MAKAKRVDGECKRVDDSRIATEDADTIIGLVEAAMGADYSALRRAGSQLVRRFSEEGQADHATRLQGVLRKRSAPLRTSGHVQELPLDGRSRLPLVDENPFPSTPILMEAETEAIVTRFIEDAHHAERLSRAGIQSGLRMILCGPPGTGKTLLAGHIASRLNKPFQVARLDATISSLLGETAKNIRGIFDHVSERSGFVLLDEIDAIAKMRDDQRELGELKRVVNTLIQGLDDLDDQTVVIAATNHPGLLDPAVWRRFPYRIEMKLPEAELRSELWKLFLAADEGSDLSDLLGAISKGLSPADIRELALGARRAAVIGDAPLVIDDLVRCVLASRSGVLAVPTGRALGGEERRRLVSALLPFKMTRAQMASLVGVSRQRVDEYVHALDERMNADHGEKRDGAPTHS
ncbi:MAG: ATP-binding protein [Mesorhizobium sp.]|nr:MAG: ATP-binding protein [Mesorhizobium sp.]RWL92877.1 MAG: ATP-binding protein [Mesorhizobium sp.]